MDHGVKAGTNRETNEARKLFDSGELPPLLNCQQAAEIAGVSRKHIRNMLSRGELNGTRLGTAWRIPRDEFLARVGLGE